MLKLEIESIAAAPPCKKEYYNSLNRIPFSISIGKYSDFPETIYCRNLIDENFIEFRFNKENSELFEIEMIGFSPNSVKELSGSGLIKIDQTRYFTCKINELESGKEDNLPMEILRTSTSVSILFDHEKMDVLQFFQIGHDVYVGLDNESYLKAIYLNEMTPEDVSEILGF